MVETAFAVAIVGIITLVALPTFDNIADRSDDQNAKKSLTVLDVELSRVEAGEPGVWPADLHDVVSVSGVQAVQAATSSTGPDVVSIRVEGTRVFAALVSESGRCWVIEHNYQSAIEWAVDDSPAKNDQGVVVGCKASSISVSANTVEGTSDDPSLIAMV